MVQVPDEEARKLLWTNAFVRAYLMQHQKMRVPIALIEEAATDETMELFYDRDGDDVIAMVIREDPNRH